MDPENASGGGAAGTAAAKDLAALESLVRDNADAQQLCSEVAKVFRVGQNEVALLKLDRSLLRFVFPAELARAGSIPVSSSSAVAAHTVSTKTGELFNTFAKVKHASIFETVKLGGTADDGPA